MTEATDIFSLPALEQVVLKHYRPMLWKGIKAGLGVIASLSLKSRSQCVALNFEGVSGGGKSVIIQILTPYDGRTQQYLERVDDFTPASFVSAAANKSAQELAEIDLLPRIRNKVILIKELAPVFRDQDDSLRKKFALLASVLDGDGLQRASGSHPIRGYSYGQRYIFNWLGATTPIPPRTHKIMAQLGNRFLFFEIFAQGHSDNDLLMFAKHHGGYDALAECRHVAQNFILAYFQKHPVDSVDPGSVEINDELQLEIIRLAKLISSGRIELEWVLESPTDDRQKQLQIGTPEGPHRVILLLQTIARGLALSANRNSVITEDLEILRHIAFSSIPASRRQVLQAMIASGGVITTPQLDSALSISRPTSLTRMKELSATRIVIFDEGDPYIPKPGSLKFAEGWTWLNEKGPVK